MTFQREAVDFLSRIVFEDSQGKDRATLNSIIRNTDGKKYRLRMPEDKIFMTRFYESILAPFLVHPDYLTFNDLEIMKKFYTHLHDTLVALVPKGLGHLFLATNVERLEEGNKNLVLRGVPEFCRRCDQMARKCEGVDGLRKTEQTLKSLHISSGDNSIKLGTQKFTESTNDEATSSSSSSNDTCSNRARCDGSEAHIED